MTGRAARNCVRAAAAVLAVALGVIACGDLRVAPSATIVAVRMTPDTLVLRVGDSALVRAAPIDSSVALHAQDLLAWLSSATAVATVDDTGLVRAVAAGTAMITATVDGISGQTVALVSGAPSAIVATAGNGQSAAVNAAVPVAPAVRVTDAAGNPVPQAAVTFAVTGGGGTLSAATPVLTDLNGVATATSWVLGPSPGANSLTATSSDAGVGGNPVTFTATATVGPPSADSSTISVSPTTILPSNGLAFATITVTVRDAAGSTITGATVVLAATGSGNVLTQPTDTTDAFGRATGAISSSVAESKTLSATVNGSVALTQTATLVVSASAPAGLGMQAQPAGAVANQVFGTQPVVDIRDGFGNRVMTATNPITVTLFTGNGTLTSAGSMTVNAVSGRATFSGLLLRGLRPAGDTLGTGPHVLQFSSPGFTAVRSDTFQVATSFAYNVLDVYGRNGCSGCHGYTYANSVNQPATLGSCAGAIRIIPGDTVNSAIYAKIRTLTPPCGVVMPPAGLMSPLQIRLIRDWILQGALNN